MKETKNSREEELKSQIEKLENEIKPLREELHNIWAKKIRKIKERVELANQGKGDFTEDELRYAAYDRCHCGAGMAYPKEVGVHGSWECSDILLGKASTEVKHTPPLPFTFYELKSEDQPSASGATTRPKKD